MKNLHHNTAVHQDGPFTYENCPRRPRGPKKRYLSVRELSKEYEMSLRVIYLLIEQDATFPMVNMGLKKKYMIDREAFETWIFKRTYKEQNQLFKIPTASELATIRR